MEGKQTSGVHIQQTQPGLYHQRDVVVVVVQGRIRGVCVDVPAPLSSSSPCSLFLCVGGYVFGMCASPWVWLTQLCRVFI